MPPNPSIMMSTKSASVFDHKKSLLTLTLLVLGVIYYSFVAYSDISKHTNDYKLACDGRQYAFGSAQHNLCSINLKGSQQLILTAAWVAFLRDISYALWWIVGAILLNWKLLTSFFIILSGVTYVYSIVGTPLAALFTKTAKSD